jgi:hypothetical protein
LARKCIIPSRKSLYRKLDLAAGNPKHAPGKKLFLLGPKIKHLSEKFYLLSSHFFIDNNKALMFLEKNFLDLVSLSDKTVFDLKN